MIGTGEPTVTGIARVADDFVYTVTRHGDGTIPAVSGRLDGAHTYYVALRAQRTDARSAGGQRRRRYSQDRCHAAPHPPLVGHATVPWAASAIRPCAWTHTGKVDLTTLDADARRAFMQTLNEPPPLRLRPPRR